MAMLFIFAYILIGWIVASVCLAIAMRYNTKRELSVEFVAPFILWPFVIIASVIMLIIKIVMWLGCITENVISKLMKGENNDKRRKV